MNWQLCPFHLIREIYDSEKELRILIAELTEKRSAFSKTLIFCQTYTDCANMYQTVRYSMGAQFTEPPGFPNFLHQFKMAEMYHRAMPVDLKERFFSHLSLLVLGCKDMLVQLNAEGLLCSRTSC